MNTHLANITARSTGITSYTGVYFTGEGARQFWRIVCPCGVEAVFPVNKLPEVDTPHPCGKPNHWTTQYAVGAQV